MSNPVSPVDSIDAQIKLLADAVINKPPFRSGAFIVPKDNLLLYYGKGIDVRRLDFTAATDEEIQHLSKSCDAATFGMNGENVLDESYRKAGKLDKDHFLTGLEIHYSGLMNVITTELLEGSKDKRQVRGELYKLNVYGPGSFFKAHKDTPRAKNMFGSLVVVLPTHHEGGALNFNHKGGSWSFDSARVIQDSTDPSSTIAYAMFFSDVEHEVTPVRSGYRVTITYNLYFEDTTSLVSILDSPRESPFFKVLERQLENPTFFPEGACLGFGLHHQYPLYNNLNHLLDCAKGSDATILQACRALSLHASFKIVYSQHSRDYGNTFILLNSKVWENGFILDEDQFTTYLRKKYGGTVIYHEDGDLVNDEDKLLKEFRAAFEVQWVTEINRMTSHKVDYVTYGYEPEADYSYGDVCLIVAIGPHGKRSEPPEIFKKR